MNPGVTVLPVQSTVRAAARSARSPTAVMRSPLIATSARRAALPLPSITEPPLSFRSQSMRLSTDVVAPLARGAVFASAWLPPVRRGW